MKGSNFELDEELCRAQLSRGSKTNSRLNRRQRLQAYASYRLGPKRARRNKTQVVLYRLDETPSIQIALLKYPGE